jgi:hypothetical protein
MQEGFEQVLRRPIETTGIIGIWVTEYVDDNFAQRVLLYTTAEKLVILFLTESPSKGGLAVWPRVRR